MSDLSVRGPVVFGPPDISGCIPEPGLQELTYTWGPPEAILGYQVLGYRLQIYLDDDTFVNSFTLSFDTFSYTINDLISGTVYKASIQAYDAYGEWGQNAFYQSATPL
jgi:hypothetical protein